MNVRLSQHDLEAIIALFLVHFLAADTLWIFGSRTDLSKKGGDIDLYIETNLKEAEDIIRRKANFVWDLEQKIGEQKIDIVINILSNETELPIYTVARTEGIRLV